MNRKLLALVLILTFVVATATGLADARRGNPRACNPGNASWCTAPTPVPPPTNWWPNSRIASCEVNAGGWLCTGYSSEQYQCFESGGGIQCSPLNPSPPGAPEWW